jgi:hypothetical protein
LPPENLKEVSKKFSGGKSEEDSDAIEAGEGGIDAGAFGVV